MEEKNYTVEVSEEDKEDIVDIGTYSTEGETVTEDNLTTSRETSAESLPDGYNANAPKISATAKVRGHAKEYVGVALTLAVCPIAIVLGMKFTGYKIVCFIVAAMGLLTAYALVRHVVMCKKVNKLLAGVERTTVTELMKELKLKKKFDFVRTLGGMVREGHLTGYEISGDELVTKVENLLPEERKSIKEILFKNKK